MKSIHIQKVIKNNNLTTIDGVNLMTYF